MKRHWLFLNCVFAASAVLSACGGNVVVDGADGDGGQGGGAIPTTPTTGQGGFGGQTPTAPTGTGGDASFAVRRLRVGDTKPDGTPSTTAWKSYGFNLDGKVSTKDSFDLCKPAAGAKPSIIYEDGEAGIDNGFGKNVLPIVLALAADTSAKTNAYIEKGAYSILIRIQGIGAGQTGTFSSSAATGGFPPDQSPQWNGLDAWPVRSSSLFGGDPSNPKSKFPGSEVTLAGSGQRVWQSFGAGEMELILRSSGFDMKIPVRGLRMSAVLSDDNSKMTGGMIGAIVDTDAFVAELAKVAASFDPSLCPPSATFQSLAQQISQAQDILLDGTQDPGQTCDGISLGFGFDAEQAQWGEAYGQSEPSGPCQ